MSRPSVRLLPETFRARLVLAFAAVVAIALALVLATLPRLLDGYFAQQEQKNLETRGRIVESFLRGQLVNTLGLDSEAPRPILDSTVPPSASDAVYAALGNRDRGFVKSLTVVVAQADVEVTITDAARPDRVAFRLMIRPSRRRRRGSAATASATWSGSSSATRFGRASARTPRRGS